MTNKVENPKPHLSREHLLALLHAMVRIRRFEEKCAQLYQQENIRGLLHLYIGEEAVAATVGSIRGKVAITRAICGCGMGADRPADHPSVVRRGS